MTSREALEQRIGKEKAGKARELLSRVLVPLSRNEPHINNVLLRLLNVLEEGE